MIRDIEIKNFRCFKDLKVSDCSRINIIVGDNGAGKTALLESLFLTLAGNPAIAFRMRQQRGLDPLVHGAPRIIEEALWSGFFHMGDMNQTVSVKLTGDGPEVRSLRIFRGSGETTLPFESEIENLPARSITLEWTDHMGQIHTYLPKVTNEGIKMPETEEDLPKFFMFAATAYGNAREIATQYSNLSIVGEEGPFIEIFKQEFPSIEDIGIQTLGGLSVLHVKVAGVKRKIPLTDLSAGITRVASVLLALTSQRRSVVLVDEIENGVYYQHVMPIIRTLVTSAKAQESQLILSTHSAEWLRAYVAVCKDDQGITTSLWRLSKEEGVPQVQKFSGADLADGLEFGEEVR